MKQITLCTVQYELSAYGKTRILAYTPSTATQSHHSTAKTHPCDVFSGGTQFGGVSSSAAETHSLATAPADMHSASSKQGVTEDALSGRVQLEPVSGGCLDVGGSVPPVAIGKTLTVMTIAHTAQTSSSN
jgi:hypothetical protein